MTTPDEHLTTLRRMLEDHEYMANTMKVGSRFHTLHTKRADALRWIIDQNAYDVSPEELVA